MLRNVFSVEKERKKEGSDDVSLDCCRVFPGRRFDGVEVERKD